MSEANDPTPVSEADDVVAVSEANDVVAVDPHAHDPHIKVLKGQPTDDELAAVIAVLASGSSAPAEPREAEQNLWGHPVDRLRYNVFSWQLVTMVERTHLRK